MVFEVFRSTIMLQPSEKGGILPNKSPPPEITADRVIVLHNPKAGARDSHNDAHRLTKLLDQHGLKTDLFSDLDAAVLQANALFEEGRLRALVGVGGDGTAAELVNRTKSGTPLTWLPRGNSNLLARYLSLDSSPEQLAKTIAHGSVIQMDAGMANGRIFLIMASCGLDAEVVNRVHTRRTGHLNSLTYFKPIWEAFRTYEYPELRVYCDDEFCHPGETPTLTARWFSVFNLPCYGGRLGFAPHADGNDGYLDLCGFRQGGFWRFMQYIAAVYLRQHRNMNDWTTRRVQRVRITADSTVPYQLDGDPGGYLPLEIEVLPNRLTMIVPIKS
jgi:diacylglycerol kinase (ATP)